MAFDYQALVDSVVTPQLQDKGRIAYVVKRVNVGTELRPEWQNTDEPVRFLPTTYSMTNRNDSVVQVGDLMGIISPETGITPEKTNDKFKMDGETYSFIDVKPYNYSGTTDMFWKIHARK